MLEVRTAATANLARRTKRGWIPLSRILHIRMRRSESGGRGQAAGGAYRLLDVFGRYE